MKNIFYLIILCSQFSFSQNTFQKIYGFGYGYSVQQTTDSGYVVFGSNYPGNNIDICVLKTNQTGDTIWTRTLDHTIRDIAFSGVQTKDGGYMITGTIENTVFTHCLIRLNANGDTLWTKLIHSSIGEFDGKSIIQTMDGGFVISGKTKYLLDGLLLMRLDSMGTVLWQKSYNNMGFDDVGSSFCQTSDHGFLIVGVENFNQYSKSIIVKTNSNGDTLWTKSISNFGFGGAGSVTETFDGNYVIAGYTLINLNSSEYSYLVKLDITGNIIWSKLYGNTDSTRSLHVSSIQQTADSGIVMTGAYSSPQGGQDVFLLKTNSIGDTLWTRYYYSVSYDFPFSIKQTYDNGFIISGTSQDSSNSGTFIYLIKTDSLGHTSCKEFIPSIVLDTLLAITDNIPIIATSVTTTQQFIYPVIGYSIQAFDYCTKNSIASINNKTIKIFPNPSSNYLTFVFPPNNHSYLNAINYFNLMGELVYTESINFQPGDSEVISDISILRPGVYIARIYGNENYQIMIIKQ